MARTLEVAVLMVGVLAVGCGGDDGGEVCLQYACTNATSLKGTVDLGASSGVLDVELCYGDDCFTGVLQPAASAGAVACATWDAEFISSDGSQAWAANDSSVCLAGAGASPGPVEVEATRGFLGSADPPAVDAIYSVVLQDAATGTTLMDATTTATYEVTRKDACHLCWQGQGTL